MLKKYEEFIEKLDCFFASLKNDPLKTTLNPFIAHYYLNQTDKELEESLESVNFNIELYDRVIEEFKKCFNDNNTQMFNDRLNEQIEDIEYMNNTNREIIIFIGKIKEERIRRNLKKQNSFLSKLKRKLWRKKIESI